MEILFFILDYIEIKIEYNYLFTLLFFFIFLTIYSTLSIPGNIIFIVAAGYFFGTSVGFLLSICSIVIGSFLFFIFVSSFLKIFFNKKMHAYTKNIYNYLINSKFEYLVIFRLIPGIPLFLQNFLLSTININKIKFLLSTFLGFTPIIYLMVFFGDHLKDFNKLKSLSFNDFFSMNFILLLFFIIFLLIIRIFILHKKN